MDPSRHGWLRTGEWGIVDEERGTQGYMIRACPSCSGNVVRRRHFERFRALMAVSHIPRRSAEWTFDTFPRDSAKQEAFEDVRRFGRGESLGAWSGMYIHGPLGRGKTGLAICALRARLEQGQPGLFWTTPDLLTDIKATYNREADGPEQAVLNQIGAAATIWRRSIPAT